MKRILILVAFTLLAGCMGDKGELVILLRKYEVGQKVVMQTGEVGVIVSLAYPSSYYAGWHKYPPSPGYKVRMGFSKEPRFFGGSEDTSRFYVREFEIEKAID